MLVEAPQMAQAGRSVRFQEESEEIHVVNTFIQVGKAQRMAWRKHSSHSAPATVLDAKDGQVPEQGEPDEEDPYAELPMTSWRTFDSFEGDHVQDLPVEAEEEEEEEDDGELGPLMDKVETFDPFEDDTHAVDAGRAAAVPLAGTPPLPAASLPEPTILPMAPAVPSQDFPRVMCVPAYPVQVMCPPVAGITGTTPSTTPNCSPRPEPPVLLGRTAQAESAAPLECLRLPNGKEMVRWKVDARKLDSQEKQILSPEFELQLPGLGLKPFRIMILAKETKGKGGRGFVKAGGKGRLFVKCETSSLAQARAMAFRVSVGPATVESKGPLWHLFTEQPCCPLQDSNEDWDLPPAVDKVARRFEVTLEVLDHPGPVGST